MYTWTHALWYKTVTWILCIALCSTAISPVIRVVAVPLAASAALTTTLAAVTDTLPAHHPLTPAILSAPDARALRTSADPPGLSVTRQQSTHSINATLAAPLLITFTVHNPWPPANVPQLADSATLTAVVAAWDTMHTPADPNTLHNVLLMDTLLTSPAGFEATPAPDQRGTELAWNLGAIPPLGSVTVTLALSLSVPTAAGALVIDTGAHAWGTRYNEPVDAHTCPVTLWPDAVSGANMSAYLQATVDANYRDPVVARATSALCTLDDALAFGQTQGYEAYTGSLRGARGTLWSAAGNSLDQANLLLATLRGHGIPARYRHGTLDDARARELIRSMFPTTGAVVGYVPAGAEVANPSHDPALLADARDHWWVEAYQDGAWVALDPSFSYSTPGQTFTTSEGEALAEIPAALRHTVTLRLEVERYDMLSYLQHSGFTYREPLTYTFTTAELVGQPLALKFLVNAQRPSAGCMVFCWVHYTYAPYLRIGDMAQVLMGHQFWELLSDYPFGQFAATAMWLHFDVRDAAGHVTRYTRELSDRIGIERRTTGYQIRGMIPELLTAGVLSKFGPDTPALVNALDNHTLYFNPSLMAPEHAAHAGENLLAAAPRVLAAQPVSRGLEDIDTVLGGGTLDVSGHLDLAAVAATVEDTTQAFNRMFAASFVVLSDQASQDLAATGLVKAYPDTPRITIASLVISPTVVTQAVPVLALDLLHDHVRAIAYPGQAKSAEAIYQMTRGMNETFLEQAVGTAFIETDETPQVRAAAGVLQAATAQEIAWLYVDATHLKPLAAAPLSAAAQARIVHAAQQGYGILVPAQPVLWRGAYTTAWWQIDLSTGATVGVGEDGLHQFLATLPAQLYVFEASIRGMQALINAYFTTEQLWYMGTLLTWHTFWSAAPSPNLSAAQTPQEVYTQVLKDTKAHMQLLEYALTFRLPIIMRR